jgi:hypothetical protein
MLLCFSSLHMCSPNSHDLHYFSRPECNISGPYWVAKFRDLDGLPARAFAESMARAGLTGSPLTDEEANTDLSPQDELDVFETGEARIYSRQAVSAVRIDQTGPVTGSVPTVDGTDELEEAFRRIANLQRYHFLKKPGEPRMTSVYSVPSKNTRTPEGKH